MVFIERKDRLELELEKNREAIRKLTKMMEDVQRSLEETKKGPPSERLKEISTNNDENI